MSGINAVDIKIRCYLKSDISEEEVIEFVEDLTYNVEHELIKDTELYDQELIPL